MVSRNSEKISEEIRAEVNFGEMRQLQTICNLLHLLKLHPMMASLIHLTLTQRENNIRVPNRDL